MEWGHHICAGQEETWNSVLSWSHDCTFVCAGLTMFVGITFPFFGALLGFFGGFAFAPTTYFVSQTFKWTCIAESGHEAWVSVCIISPCVKNFPLRNSQINLILCPCGSCLAVSGWLSQSRELEAYHGLLIGLVKSLLPWSSLKLYCLQEWSIFLFSVFWHLNHQLLRNVSAEYHLCICCWMSTFLVTFGTWITNSWEMHLLNVTYTSAAKRHLHICFWMSLTHLLLHVTYTSAELSLCHVMMAVAFGQDDVTDIVYHHDACRHVSY